MKCYETTLNSHTSNWFYRTNRPYFGILRQITWSDHIKDPQDPHRNLILQFLAISASSIDLRKCLIYAKNWSQADGRPALIVGYGLFQVWLLKRFYSRQGPTGPEQYGGSWSPEPNYKASQTETFSTIRSIKLEISIILETQKVFRVLI